MSDDLDDLFGALDDDDNNNDNVVVEEKKVSAEPPPSKKQATNENDKESMQEEADKKSSSSKEKEVEQDLSTSVVSSTVTTNRLTSVMNAKTASRFRNSSSSGHPHDESSSGAVIEGTTRTSGTDNTSNETPTPSDKDHEVSTGTSHDKTVRSYSAYPKNLPPGHELPKVTPSDRPAKEYSFPLDPFQAQAVGYIEKEESVLVAAHTSAGKTAVAEYAIAKSLNNGQRVVYTSPIKVCKKRNESS